MQFQPTVVPGFVGVQVVEHDVDGGVGPSGDDVVHDYKRNGTSTLSPPSSGTGKVTAAHKKRRRRISSSTS